MILFGIASQITSTLSIVGADSRSDMLRAKAISTLVLLAEDPGEPTNWHEVQLTDIKRPGLAVAGQPYELSIEKVNRLNTERGALGECLLLEPFRLGGYRLTIANSTTSLAVCGPAGIGPVTVLISKPIFISGDYGSITLEVW
jgi:hypothetical protein